MSLRVAAGREGAAASSNLPLARELRANCLPMPSRSPLSRAAPSLPLGVNVVAPPRIDRRPDSSSRTLTFDRATVSDFSTTHRFDLVAEEFDAGITLFVPSVGRKISIHVRRELSNLPHRKVRLFRAHMDPASSCAGFFLSLRAQDRFFLPRPSAEKASRVAYKGGGLAERRCRTTSADGMITVAALEPPPANRVRRVAPSSARCFLVVCRARGSPFLEERVVDANVGLGLILVPVSS